MNDERTSKQYVLGFAFDEAYRHAILIEKNRPEWQAGRLNGLGGKIEPGETPLAAMQREFYEEAGVDAVYWREFSRMEGHGWVVHCFAGRCFAAPNSLAPGGEVVSKVPVKQGVLLDPSMRERVVPNLLWLLPAAQQALVLQDPRSYATLSLDGCSVPQFAYRPLSYLGCPYSVNDTSISKERAEEIMEFRFRAVSVAAANIMRQGDKNVFSPITHSHPLRIYADMGGTWEDWRERDTQYLRVSSEMLVLKLDGWQDSVGLTDEIKIARELAIPVRFIEPCDVGVLGSLEAEEEWFASLGKEA